MMSSQNESVIGIQSRSFRLLKPCDKATNECKYQNHIFTTFFVTNIKFNLKNDCRLY
jgi:hypothetical protein